MVLKQSFMGEFFSKNYTALAKYLKSVKSEIKRVTWPSREELYSSTILVSLSLVVVSIFVYIFNQLFERFFTFLHNL